MLASVVLLAGSGHISKIHLLGRGLYCASCSLGSVGLAWLTCHSCSVSAEPVSSVVPAELNATVLVKLLVVMGWPDRIWSVAFSMLPYASGVGASLYAARLT